MTRATVPALTRLVVDRPWWCAFLAAASLLLSAWAVWLDPVIDSGGIDDLRAAELCAEGRWRAGLEAAGRPFYSLIVASLSGLTGLPVIWGARALDAAAHAALVVGFAALAQALGGGHRAGAIAAALALLYPALNGFRPDASGDTVYWALYVWSLAGFLRYALEGDRGGLRIWLLAGLAGLLFSLEMLMFLLIVPAWWCVRSAGRGRKITVIAAAVAVMVCYGLWQHAWRTGVPLEVLFNPVDAVAGAGHDLGRAIRFKLEGLREEFLDKFSSSYDDVALVMTLSTLSLAALVKALGPVYTVLAGAAVTAVKRTLPDGARYWWGVFVLLSVLLLLVPAFTRLAVAPREAMVAALTVLAIVPPALEHLWRNGGEHAGRRWLLPGALALVAVTGLAGLDLRSDDAYRRQAGLWLKGNAPPGASLLSNSRVVVFYSGLDGYRRGADYSWHEAMTAIWRDRWRDYDFLALEIAASNAHREGILMRRIEAQPVKIFSNDAGDRVLVFETGG